MLYPQACPEHGKNSKVKYDRQHQQNCPQLDCTLQTYRPNNKTDRGTFVQRETRVVAIVNDGTVSIIPYIQCTCHNTSKAVPKI